MINNNTSIHQLQVKCQRRYTIWFSLLTFLSARMSGCFLKLFIKFAAQNVLLMLFISAKYYI